MSRTSPASPAVCTLLLCLCASGVAGAAEFDAPKPASITDTLQEHSFRSSIRDLEYGEGAYAPGLSEQLLSLGLSLQAQGRHEEAVGLFKRGVHLTRINDGLYNPGQVPLLQGQINSHLALGQYLQADDRQHYMYQVQLRSMDSGEPRAKAFMQQAKWQHDAYRMGLGELGFSRLMNMWDLYRLALNDIVSREGDKSLSLLSPLTGMLQAQYLISSYQGESEGGFASSDDLSARQEMNRFNAYRAQSYKKGQAVILAMYDIENQNHGEQSTSGARALSMLGDWQLWHDERDEAWSAYQNAMVELAERDDAQVQIDQLFGRPVALPDIEGVRPLPEVADAAQGDILLEFDVSERGRVLNLERLDENEVSAARANRLMRKLRKTKFRPRFEAGEPVNTEKVVKAYVIQ